MSDKARTDYSQPSTLSLQSSDPLRWLKGWSGVAVLAGLGYVVLYLGWFFLRRVVPSIDLPFIADAAYMPMSLFATIMAFVVAAQRHFDSRLRLAWFLLGLSSLITFLGDTVYLFLNVAGLPTYPSLADVFYVAFYVFIFGGLLVFPGGPRYRAERLRALLDLSIVAVAAITLVWYFIIAPNLRLSEPDWASQFLGFAYPLGDVLVITGVVALLFRRPEPTTRSALWFYLVGLGLFVVADVFYVIYSLAGVFESGQWFDILYILTYFFIGLAGLRQARPTQATATRDWGAVALVWLSRLLPALALATCYGALAIVASKGVVPSLDATILLVGTVVVTLLLIIRLGQMLRRGTDESETGVLVNMPLGAKVALLIAILLLGTMGVGATAVQGLRIMRFHIENMYSFMLVPIVAINQADAALADTQLQLEALEQSGKDLMERTTRVNLVTASQSKAQAVLDRYNTEWVTTTSADFTDLLKSENRLDLQETEVETLAALNTDFARSLSLTRQYLASVETGQPDAGLADKSRDALNETRIDLRRLIDVNNEFAALSERVALTAYEQGLTYMILAGVLTLLVGLVVAFIVTRSITQPMSALTQAANTLERGELEVRLTVSGQDEVGRLARAFNEMSAQLRNTLGSLQNRTRDLTLTAEIGRTISQERDLEKLLTQATDLIRARFDLYHTQIYLVDESGRQLVLRAGTGAAGREMLSRNHRLPIDRNSLNGMAAVEKREVLVADTAASPSFRPNPLLPNTRAELSLPLLIGERLLGVLDLQADRHGVLTRANMAAFEPLTGQLAIAIENAALFSQAERARREVEAQARRLIREGWQDYLDAVHRPERFSYAYAPAGEGVTPNAPALSARIELVGQPVGQMEVVGAENTQWTPEDRELVEAVARQVATQVENLRLLAQSDHYRTEAEQAMRRVTREGWNEYTQRTELRTGYVYMDDAVLPETTAPALASPVMQPLSVRGESIGEVAVEAEEAELPLDAQRILAAVADQLSAHIENLRLTERTENALTMTQRLYQVTSRINAAGNWNEVLNAVGDNLRLPGINRLVMFEHEVNAETNELIATTAVAGWYSGEGAPLGPLPRRYEGAVFNVFKLMLSPTPIFFNDLDTDPRVDPNTLEASRRLQVRAVATLPLRVAGRMVGTLLLQSEQPRTFTEAELEPFLAVVDTLAVALDNLRLTRQTQAALAETEKLYVSNARLSAATTLDEALQAAAQPGITLGADSARLFIMNLNVAGQPEAITLAAAWQRVGDPLIPVGARFNLADFAYSQVWLADKYNPLLIENANTDSRLDPAARAIYLQSQTVGSVLLPLTVDNRWVGLVLVNWAEPHKFTEADQRLYRTLAGQAAVVVNNRLLFEEAQRRARREALINTITQKIQNTASIETALQTAIQEVGLALKAQQTRVEFGVSGQPGDVKPNGAPANGGARTRSTL